MNDVTIMSAFQFGSVLDGNLYGITTIGGLLVSYSIEKNNIVIVDCDNEIYGTWAYSIRTCICNDNLYVAANRGNEILEYSFVNRKFKHYFLNNKVDRDQCFIGILNYNNYVYVFNRYSNDVIRINSITGDLKYIPLKTGISANKKSGIATNERYYFLYETGELFCFNLSGENVEYFGCIHEVKNVRRLEMIDGILHVLMRHGDIWAYDIGNNNTDQLVKKFSNEYDAGSFVKTDYGFVILPRLSNEILVANEGIIKVLSIVPDSYPSLRYMDKGRGLFEEWIEKDAGYLFLTKCLGDFLWVSKVSPCISWIKPFCPPESEFRKYVLKDEGIIKEGDVWKYKIGLEDYIDYIIKL